MRIYFLNRWKAKTRPIKRLKAVHRTTPYRAYEERSKWIRHGNYYSIMGRTPPRQRNNLQSLYKRKSRINQKLRVRKFKLRVTQATPIRNTSRGLIMPRRGSVFAIRLTKATRVTYKTLIGMEKAVMVSKGKVKIKYRKYPDFFVTKKSSKSRMGKGKGKISGRVVKLKRHEAFIDVYQRRYRPSSKARKALRAAIPGGTSRIVFHNKWARRFYTMKHCLINKRWMWDKPKKKKKQWQIDLEVKGQQLALFRSMYAWRKNKRQKKRPSQPKAVLYSRQIPVGFEFAEDIRVRKFRPRERFKNELYARIIGKSCRKMMAWRLHKCTLQHNSWSFDRFRWEYAYNNPEYRRALSGNSVRMVSISGALSRRIKEKWWLGRIHLKKIYALQFMPDADGYYGREKTANYFMRRRRALAARSPRWKIISKFASY